MRISDEQVQKILQMGGVSLFESETGFETSPKDTDQELIKHLTTEILAMPDREAAIMELKARIEAGEYKPSGEEIADAMVRRHIADRMR